MPRCGYFALLRWLLALGQLRETLIMERQCKSLWSKKKLPKPDLMWMLIYIINVYNSLYKMLLLFQKNPESIWHACLCLQDLHTLINIGYLFTGSDFVSKLRSCSCLFRFVHVAYMIFWFGRLSSSLAGKLM